MGSVLMQSTRGVSERLKKVVFFERRGQVVVTSIKIARNPRVTIWIHLRIY